MKNRLAILLLLLMTAAAHAARFPANAPATTNNADSCDIGPYPAATLLLPYFEVDFQAQQQNAQTTIFTVTNVSDNARVANVTLWTDLAYPILSFPIFLTGYDSQAINLYDVFARGALAPPAGTTSAARLGPLSLTTSANVNLAPTVSADCEQIPRFLPAQLLTDLRSGLTTGSVSSCGTARVGTTHTHAIGYVTIDSVRTCSPILPTNERYFTDVIAYENVLIGDSQQINPDALTGNYAGGNPLVHIRAVPATAAGVTNLPYTFYDRLTPRGDRQRDRRQPLPSVFAARYIQSGAGNFNTNFKIWREAATGPDASCADYSKRGSQDATEVVRFDEHENPTTYAPGVIINAALPISILFPETSSTPSSSWNFPPMAASDDLGGWMYLNLATGSPALSVAPFAAGRYSLGSNARQNQNWVVISMSAEGRYAVEWDAAALGNGCSRAVNASEANNGNLPIGPLPDQTP
jgi:hypothetical protein